MNPREAEIRQQEPLTNGIPNGESKNSSPLEVDCRESDVGSLIPGTVGSDEGWSPVAEGSKVDFNELATWILARSRQ